ncbi:MAG: redoxin domain-containing protein [Asgard group archaeon]|nr:redoxin domain-containing protein [Asgard group archaeon]
MMNKRLSIVIFCFALLIVPTVLPFITIQSKINDSFTNETEPNIIHNGAPALDWNLKEIKSDTNYTFSSLAGKVILMDFFATWCVPCRDAMPLLGEIKDYFSGETNFVLMSIGVDLSESEAQLETFASSYDMTWWVFRDTVNMDVYYNIEFIPSLVIVNPTQYVYYTEIGMSDTQHIIDIIEDLLDFSDTDIPDITSFEVSEDSISILNNAFTATANIIDTELRHVNFSLELGDYSEVHDIWVPSTNTIEYDFDIDPLIIWDETQSGTTNATITVVAEDFVGNSNTSQIVLDVDFIEDTSDPIVTIDSVTATKAAYGWNFEISATVTDDTILSEVSIEIWDGTELIKSDVMDQISATEYESNLFSVQIANTQNISIIVIAHDIAGNVGLDSEQFYPSGAVGITTPIIILTIFLANLIIIPMRKLRSQK